MGGFSLAQVGGGTAYANISTPHVCILNAVPSTMQMLKYYRWLKQQYPALPIAGV